MTKTPWLLVGLALLPLAADAQMIGPAPVSAPIYRPTIGSLPVPGITVFGASVQRVPVRDVRFSAFARGTVDPHAVLDAMRAAGITDASVTAPPGAPLAGNLAVLRGTITQATQAKLNATADAAGAYVRAHPGVSIDNVQFFAAVSACDKVEETARQAALAQARQRADAIAAASGVALGPVSSVDEGGGCPVGADTANGPPVDVASLTTSLTVTERVTYAIAGAAATRRRPL